MINKQNLENLKTKFLNGKFEEKINIINKVLKIILQASSLLTFLSIIIIITEYNYTFEDNNFTILYGINSIIVYSAFYSIIFGVLPTTGILISIEILNRKLEIEIIKTNDHFKRLIINYVLIILAVLITFYYYKSRMQY